MNKLVLFFTACLFSLGLNAQVNYYVSATGDDANDGLSTENAMASVVTAFNAVTTSYAADQTEKSYTINVGEGSFVTSGLAINSLSGLEITIKGQGANLTTLTGGETIPSEVRLVAPPTGGQLNKNTKIMLEDMKVYNYGFSDGSAGAIVNFAGAAANVVTLTATRCAFNTLEAKVGAVVSSNHGAIMGFYQCSFEDIKATNFGSTALPMFNIDRGNLTIENCFFTRCTRDYTNTGAEPTPEAPLTSNGQGVIIKSQPAYNWVVNNLNVVNNTFVDCGITKGDNLDAVTEKQSLISLSNPLEGTKPTGGTIHATIANNIFLGTTLDGVDLANYVDIYSLNSDPDASSPANGINYTNSTNNLLTAIDGFPQDGNIVFADATYANAAVDFIMDGDNLKYETSDNGLTYASAKGSLIVGMSLVAVQPSVDLIGTTRPGSGSCVGAIEYIPVGGQYITFDEIAPVHIDDAVDITLEENSSAGLPITYVSSDETVVSITNGFTLHPVGAGLATITASQAGDDTYDPAEDVTRTVYFAADEATFYVRADGDNLNDGLTADNAVATLSKAAALAVADGLSITYIIDVDGVITNNASSAFAFNRAEDISVQIQGAGADQTIYQMKTDAEYDAIIAAVGQSAGRVFSTVKNTGAGNIDMEVADMTFRNFGFTNDNGGALFNLNQNVVVDVTMKRCNIERGVARSGALVQANNGTSSFSLEGCYVADMRAINKNVFNSAITIAKNSSFSATNTVFSHCIKDTAQWGPNAMDTIQQGNVISFTPNTSDASLELINNTFVGDSALRVEASRAQSTIFIHDTVKASYTIANNLFIGGGAASTVEFYNVLLPVVDSAVITNSTNNVMIAQSGLGDAGNDIDATYTYEHANIAFIMDGTSPQLFSTDEGVKYVVAEGTSIPELGLSDVAPDYDIAGNMRSETAPAVGAYEYAGETPKLDQTITFPAIDSISFANATAITLEEFSSAGLAITYVSSDPSVASVSGNVITPESIGKATITASQAGNDEYNAADDVVQVVNFYDPTSIDNSVMNTISLYPNPVSDVLYIIGDVARISVYNITGQLVSSHEAYSRQINVSMLSSGLYIVKGLDEEGKTIAVERLIKK